MRPITASLLGLLAAGTVDSLPPPRLPVIVSPAPTGTLSEALVVAERQHAWGIECGTQYMFDMAGEQHKMQRTPGKLRSFAADME
jgi:hypothetical protein